MKLPWIKSLFLLGLFSVTLVSCGDEDVPEEEDEEEIITDVTLTFTSGSSTVVARAQDPDGEGPQGLEVLDSIILDNNLTYDLSIELENSIEGESITEEIEEEDEEHMFFFGFSDGLFSDPAGNGNIDSRGDAVNYNDQDENGFPVGLNTSWTTSFLGTGEFRVVLKHQPELKTASSDANTGESDVDITWGIRVNEN